jgi:hypothetical protein
LGCLMLAALLSVSGCGLGSEEGSIKAPKREEMAGGAAPDAKPQTPSKGKRSRRAQPELKTMTLGGKKM